MRGGPVDVDGRLVAADPAQDGAGFFTGPGVYETILAVRGQLPFLSLHLRRMHDAATILQLPSPPPATELSRRLHRLLGAHALPAGIARVHLRLAPESFRARVTAVNPRLDRQRATGIEVATIRTEHVAGPHKLLERTALQQAGESAHERGAAEAVLLDPNHQLLEGATSNVFLVRDGEVCTPPLDGRILPGITRATVLDLAREQTLAVHECGCTLDDAAQAEEIFVTSAIRLLLPVVGLDGERVGPGTPGPVTRKLLAALLARAGLANGSVHFEPGL